MATLRELKGRIGSVASSEKITGAMKMISSAKMHRAESDLRKLLPFRTQIETIIGNLLSSDADFSSPLSEPREVNTAAIVVLGSDDGLWVVTTSISSRSCWCVCVRPGRNGERM